MPDFSTTWNKQEFIAYILLYASNADHIESEEERAFMLSKVDKRSYINIHKQFEKDNDYQSIQKILWTADKFSITKNEIDEILKEVKALFKMDGEFSGYEQNLVFTLKMLFK